MTKKPRARICGQHCRHQRHSAHVRRWQRDKYGATREAG